MQSTQVTLRRRSSGLIYQRLKRSNALERGEHGTRAAYRCGCRCRKCTEANAVAETLRRHLNAALNDRPVRYHCSTRPIEQHVTELRGQGWTLTRIAKAAGVAPEAFMLALRRGTMMNTTAQKILSVK
jgi:hypothetical protein